MWNPNAYRDTDFGLGEGESFEPDVGWEEEFVPESGELYIQTVLGPVRPDEAGVTLMQEFPQWAPTGKLPGDMLNNPQAMMTDLESFFTASGRTLVAGATADTGRDAGVLKTLAQHAPVNIIASTGCWSCDNPANVKKLIAPELADGLDGAGVKPGMITIRMNDSVSELLSVVSEAREQSGLPLTMHVDDRQTIDQILQADVDLSGMVVGGPGVDREEVIGALAERDAFVLVTGLQGNSDTDRAGARIVAGAVRAGHAERMLISSGFQQRNRLNGYGAQPGLAFIVEQFAVMLLEEGMEALEVRAMLIDNAARALSIRMSSIAG